jgi:hypothetical protein
MESHSTSKTVNWIHVTNLCTPPSPTPTSTQIFNSVVSNGQTQLLSSCFHFIRSSQKKAQTQFSLNDPWRTNTEKTNGSSFLTHINDLHTDTFHTSHTSTSTSLYYHCTLSKHTAFFPFPLLQWGGGGLFTRDRIKICSNLCFCKLISYPALSKVLSHILHDNNTKKKPCIYTNSKTPLADWLYFSHQLCLYIWHVSSMKWSPYGE